MKLSMSIKIRKLLKEKNITIKELSFRLGTSNQNLANKLKRDNFSINELIEIAHVTDTNFEADFISRK